MSKRYEPCILKKFRCPDRAEMRERTYGRYSLYSDFKSLTPQNQKYREALESVYNDLMNLQPHIPEACYPNHQTFIDAHVDKAMKTLRETLKQ